MAFSKVFNYAINPGLGYDLLCLLLTKFNAYVESIFL